MHRSAIFVAAALASAVTPAIAHASHASYERPYAGDERPELGSQEVRLAEVSADPRDGADTIALRGLGDFTHLELRAREALVDIHGLGLRLRDGRTEWLDARMRIAPGQQRTIELPLDARRVEAIVVDYGDPDARRRDRTPARLEIYGAAAGDCDAAAGSARPYADERAPRRLDRPAYPAYPAYNDGARYDRSGRRIPPVAPGGWRQRRGRPARRARPRSIVDARRVARRPLGVASGPMTHPFPYVGSGIAAARKAMECFVCFRAPVPKDERTELERGVPAPLAGFFHWSPRALAFGHADDSLQWVVRAHYDHVVDEDDEHEPDPELPSEAQWKALNAELDAWLLGVHARHPVAAFVKPIDEEYSTATDAWHEWSCERIPTEVLPALADLGKQHAGVAAYVAERWRAWAQDQPVDRQRALVAALPAEARAALERHDALFEPAPPPPPRAPRPTPEESEQIWRHAAAAAGPLRLEDAYTAALIERGLDDVYTLTNHLHVLEEAGRHADVALLARAVLASGSEFPAHWIRPAVDALVALDRVPEAGALMPALVGHLETYSPDMLVTAMRYHRAAGEPAVEAMLYHAGVRWFTTFTYHVTKAQAKAYGSAPEDLPEQFAAWLARWVAGTEWDAATQPRLGHWLVWFETIGEQCFPDQIAAFEAERDRRAAARARLPEADDEASARALIEQLLPTADTEDAARAFHALRERAPVAAYDFLLGAIRNERRRGYRFPRGERVDAVTSLLWLALNVPALRERLAEAYEIGEGYVLVKNPALHGNLGCAAARLGDRAAALRHVGRALALDWEDPRQLHDDEDFASLRGDPEFEQLFAADAERRAAAGKAAARAKRSESESESEDEPKPRARRPAGAKAKARGKAARGKKAGAASKGGKSRSRATSKSAAKSKPAARSKTTAKPKAAARSKRGSKSPGSKPKTKTKTKR